jgi:hypothetical protein
VGSACGGNPSGKGDLIKPLRFRKERIRPGKSCGIVIAGPYTLRDLYKSRAIDWCLRALGLTFFHDHVAVLLPGSVARRPFVATLEACHGATMVRHFVSGPRAAKLEEVTLPRTPPPLLVALVGGHPRLDFGSSRASSAPWGLESKPAGIEIDTSEPFPQSRRPKAS